MWNFCAIRHYEEKEKATYRRGENTLSCKSHKELLSQQQKDQKKFLKNWAEDQNIHFSKEYMQTANKHKKRCSIALVTSETASKPQDIT